MRIFEVGGLIHSAKRVVIKRCMEEGINPVLFKGSGKEAYEYVLNNSDLKIHYDTYEKDYSLWLDNNNTLHIGIM